MSPNPARDHDHCESLYWVFTQRCNDQCAHCYNLSGPHGATITLEDCLAIVRNLPSRIDRLILSGGEPLTERPKLYAILEALRERYRGQTQVMLQTNGDLMTGEILDQILARGVSRIDVASIDRFHRRQGERRAELETLFKSRGMLDEATGPLIAREDYLQRGILSFGFWGATEDMWLGGNWARGRAMEKDLWLKDGAHNFCGILSGAKGFLGGTELPQEISIQLWKINPCCPGTREPLGDARVEKVAEVLGRHAGDPIFEALNLGDPYAMGESLGFSGDYGRQRAQELGSVCLWCDEFFALHRPASGATAAGSAEKPKPLLPILGQRIG